MADGRRVENWEHTASLCTALGGDPKKLLPKWFRRRMMPKRPIRPTPGGVEMLTRALCDSRDWARK
jgi:hypothetical protein